MNNYTPSHILTIDQGISNISEQIRVLYLESDCPNLLELVLKENGGSHKLRSWLGIPGNCESFRAVQEKHYGRLLTVIFEDHGSYGRLNDSTYYTQKLNITAQTHILTPSHSATYFEGKDALVELEILQVDGKPEDVASEDDSVIDLRELPINKYIIAENGKVLCLKMPSEGKNSQMVVTNETCRFFYMTNADVLDEKTLSRMIQAFLENSHYPRAKLILIGTTRRIPEALTEQVQLIRLGAPSFEDVRHELLEKIQECTDEVFLDNEIDRYARILTGLTHLQLEAIFARLEPDYLMQTLNDLPNLVWEQKRLESEKDNTLVYQRIEVNPGVVGMAEFSRWLNTRLPDMAKPEEAEESGIEPPRGVILAGVPGTGKSQLAQQVAYRWSRFEKDDPRPISFIEFNIGNLSSKNYGESEAKLEKFLKRISEQAPAILFVDEVEKTFYQDQKHSAEMHEVKKQQMGRLLGWLQEHKDNIFTFMTSNDISILPPELIRSGRLSERFFVFLPNYTELMCMLYSFLRGKAKSGIFDDKFTQDIRGVCDLIDQYNEQYGCGSEEKDSELDQELSKTMKNSPLHVVLEELAKYAEAHARTPFLTGADMKELVNSTLLQLRRENQKPYSSADFANAMVKICCSPTFLPYGQSNMEKLVKLFLNCDYRDVSAHPLLPRYQFDRDKAQFCMDRKHIQGTNPDNAYDQYMQKTLIREIEKAAGEEKAERERLEYQKEQMEHQRAQWEKERIHEKERDAYEANAWELTRLQLQQFREKK